MLHLEEHHEGRVVLATIDRPQRRNAVDHATLVALGDALEDAVARDRRVLVLTGAGGSFSAGADLTGVEGEEFAGALRRALTLLAEAPLVTIAAIEGHALGAGVQMAAFADLRVATATARFGIPAAKLGIAVDQATVARVVELCGGGIARDLLLAAGIIDGAQAHGVGLVQRLGTLADALVWAGELSLLAPLTIRAHKAALSAVRFAGSGPRSDAAASAMALAWASDDLVEGRTAFMEKRPPTFLGR
jgi:enoyl-CoA hydratase